MVTSYSRPQGNTLTPYGTPLHVSELMLLLLKQTFAEFPEQHPLHYDEDASRSSLAFDVSLNKDSAQYGHKPLIVVARGVQSTAPIVVGDLAANTLALHAKKSTGLVSASLDIRMLSRHKGEVEILAQHVFGFCLLCRTILPHLLGVHMVDSINLSPVARFDQDDAMFLAQLDMNYSMQYKWDHTVEVNLLRAVQTRIETAETSRQDSK